jgi:hypothetical protein
MVIWAIIILVLDALLYASMVSNGRGWDCSIYFCIGIAIAALGILVRTLMKIRAGRFEQLNEELKRAKSDNKELIERISNLREQQVIERTDKDLV